MSKTYNSIICSEQHSPDLLILAYTSGLLDGEGCISMTKSNRRNKVKFSLTVQVQMTDKMPIEFLFKNFGGCFRSYKARKSTNKPIWFWSKRHNEAAEFLKKVIPFLQNKREQAEIAVQYMDKMHEMVIPGRRGYPKDFKEYQMEIWNKLRDLKKVPV